MLRGSSHPARDKSPSWCDRCEFSGFCVQSPETCRVRNLTFAGELDCFGFFLAPPLSRQGAGVGVSRRVKCAGGGGCGGWRGVGRVGANTAQQIKREVCVSGQAASLPLCNIHRHVAIKLAGNWTCKSLILRCRLFKWDSTRVLPPPILSRVACNARYYSLSRLFILCYIFISGETAELNIKLTCRRRG